MDMVVVVVVRRGGGRGRESGEGGGDNEGEGGVCVLVGGREMLPAVHSGSSGATARHSRDETPHPSL